MTEGSYELYGNHEDSLERKLALAQVKQILEARAQQFQH